MKQQQQSKQEGGWLRTAVVAVSLLVALLMVSNRADMSRFTLLTGQQAQGVELVTEHASQLRTPFVGRKLDQAIMRNLNIPLAIEEVQKTLNLIYNRYECSTKLGEAFMLIQNNIIESDWNLIKLRFAEKILSEAGTEEARYLMVFGGSSVTAGHDNGINLSYPLIVQKRMHSGFEAAGVDLQVHNMAQGANSCLPSNYCYESMGGHDPDFVGWEQSFNCGRDAKIFEIPARFAAWSKTPGSVYYANSGSDNPRSCNYSEFKKPWSDDDWTPDMEGLPEWKPTAEDVKYWKDRFNFAYTKAGSTSARFGSGSYMYRDNGVAVLGLDLWSNYKPQGICEGVPGLEDKCNPDAFYERCLMKMMRKEATVYGFGKGARHHPSKALHQLRGELISFLYSLMYLDALYDIQSALSAEGASGDAVPIDVAKRLKDKFSAERASMVKTTELPKPKYCGSYYCETKPHCYTDYHSHFSKDLFLTDQLVGNTTWVSEITVKGHDEVFHEKRQGYYSKDSEQSIHFKIDIGVQKFVIVCGYHFPNFHLANEYYVELSVDRSRLNENYEPNKDKVINWETDVNIEWGVCQRIHNLPSGTHVLGIRFKENEKKAAAGISHLLTWD